MFTKLYGKFLTLKEKGQGLVEYAIIVAVVITAALLIVGIFGDAFKNLYLQLINKINAITL